MEMLLKNDCMTKVFRFKVFYEYRIILRMLRVKGISDLLFLQAFSGSDQEGKNEKLLRQQ